MSKQTSKQPSKKELYAEYTELAKESGIENPKSLNSFTNIKAVQAAIAYLKEGHDADKVKEPKKVKKAKAAGAVPVSGNFVKLTSKDRAKLRRLASEGKVKHPWGDKWQLTRADYDRLMGGAAAN